jgi:hypothetical protein
VAGLGARLVGLGVFVAGIEVQIRLVAVRVCVRSGAGVKVCVAVLVDGVIVKAGTNKLEVG